MTLPLFPVPPAPAPPPKAPAPNPAAYVPDVAAVRARERRILDALRTPGTLADILRRSALSGMPLTQSATVCDLGFMVRDGLLARSDSDEPVYSVARTQ